MISALAPVSRSIHNNHQMRRFFLIIIAGLLFFLTWQMGVQIGLVLAVFLNALVMLHLELATLRRFTFTLAALAAKKPSLPPLPDPPPFLLALVPCRNEASTLAATLEAWDAVEYPHDGLRLVFIDDASTDRTAELLKAYAVGRPWVEVVSKPGPSTGKGAALSAGLAAAPEAEAVVVFDADARPAPDCLQLLAAHLSNPAVAAVAGRMLPDYHPSTPAAYSRLEAAVHQRITVTGAAWLGFTVPLLGSAYLVRYSALKAIGFDPTHRLEDIDLTMRLLTNNFNIAFEPRARCAHRPPASLHALAVQRAAWSRGFHRIATAYLWTAIVQAGSLVLALDRFLFATGYLDRITFSLAIVLAVLDATVLQILWMPWWFPVLVAAVPALQCVLAMLLDGWKIGQVARIIPASILAFLDLATEWSAMIADLLHLPRQWRRTLRAGEEPKHG